MERNFHLVALVACLALCGSINALAQDKINVSDIKGIWISVLLYNDLKGDFEKIPNKDVISFGFTEGKGKLNNARHTGLYRLIDGGSPKIFYYSIENNKILLYDSSDNPLPYFLVIESVIPKVSMTAILYHNEGSNTTSSKMEFLFHEKKN